MSKKPTKPTYVEWFSVMGSIHHIAPVSLHNYATNFLLAAKAAPSPERDKFTPARTYLVCHAIELALKSFLSTKKS
jgi:hypothetical protein